MENILRPHLRFASVETVSLAELKKHQIRSILLDLDNTLIDYQRTLKTDVINWVEEAKDEGFDVYILSNTNKIGKVSAVAEKLQIPYLHSARKPMKKGFLQAMKEFHIIPEQTAMIGDQLFTDVIGANRMGMLSIYVEPISKREHWYTSWKRPIEAYFLKKW